MGEPKAFEPKVWPSDSKAFVPSVPADVPIVAPAEPPLGKVIDMGVIPRRPMRVPPVKIPTEVFPSSEEGTVRMAAPPAPPTKPPLVATAAPSPDEEPEGSRISAERLEFLERVEALVGAESRINDLERENQALLNIVSRLQMELQGFKKGAPKA